MPPTTAGSGACNAGTIQIGPHAGQSNDVSGNPIYLCFGDSIFINHDGNAQFMDPQPLTTPGVGYILYSCPPTATGPDTAAINDDPCVFRFGSPQNANPFVSSNPNSPAGDIWFRNLGALQNAFNAGGPIQMWFAPATLDDHGNNGWEVVNGNSCVNVNTAEAFSVVYLNAIEISGINTNVGIGCIGRFKVEGGLPQFDNTAKYTIDISLASNPTVKGLIHLPQTQFNHGANVIFSVPVPGLYNVTIEDGKSCGATAQINMAGCDDQNNVILNAPSVTAAPASQICVPITLKNFNDLLGLSFNVGWDENVVTFASFQNINPNLNFVAGVNGQINPTTSGLSFVYFSSGADVSIPDGETLFEICFDVVGALNDCSPITAPNFPAVMGATDAMGEEAALIFENGSVCIGNTTVLATVTASTTCNTPGNISITVTQGAAPFDITYTGPSNGSGSIGTLNGNFTANNLPAGVYTVTVVDNVGNSTSATATVTVNSLGITGLNFVQPTCQGLNDGTASVQINLNGSTVSNPGSEYSFQWNPSSLPNSGNVSGLASGQYSVTVTNSTLGCTATASSFMGQPQPIADLTIAVDNASCTGVANGGITYTATGGTPFVGGDYKFDWAFSTTSGGTKTPLPNLSQTANPATISNTLLPGFYYLTITDANGCKDEGEVEVTAAKTLSMAAGQIVNAKCFGSTDGSVSIAVSTVPNQLNQINFWDYVPKPATSTATPGATSISVTGLPAGTYTFTAIDTAGCTVVQPFTIGQPQAIAVSTSVVSQPTCTGVTDGAIVLNLPSGGVPPFSYKWSHSASTLPNQNNLPEGSYTVTVTDQNACTNTLTVALTLPPPPPVSGVDSTSVKCGSDGCLSVIVAGGPYNFAWKNLSNGSNAGTTQQICNLNGGAYAVAVSDANNCTFRDTVILEGVDGLVFIDTLLQQPSCFGLSDGQVSVSVAGGTPNYTFLWSGSQTSQLLTNQAAGIFSVTVTDQNSCTLSGTFALPNPPAIIAFFTNIKPASCDSECDGTATIVAELATTPPSKANFTFNWSDGLSFDDSTRTNICAGFVKVTIRDANNCFRIDSVFIDAPEPVVADTFYTIPARCDGDSNGEAFVNGAGGNGAPFDYAWSNGAATQMVTGLDSAQYIVTISDKDGCTGTQILVVQDPDPIVVLKDDLESEDIICNGTDSGKLAVTVSGGNQNQGALSFVWTNGVDTVGNTQKIDGLGVGSYSVTVTDPKGCTGVGGEFPLNDPPPVVGEFLPWDELNCFGEQTTLYIDTIYGGLGGPYQFSVDYGVTLDKDFPVSIGGGKHVITYFDRVGCGSEDSITVAEPEQILVNFNPKVVEIELGDSTDLRPLITGAAVDTFFWTPTKGLNDPKSLNPYATTYESQTYVLTIFDAKGCSGTGEVRVDVDPNRNVYIPNIFSPGSTTGLNERFNLYVGAGVKGVKSMVVFDRWGEKMYERLNFYPNNNDFSEGWDGSFKGKRMNPGVYVYLIEVEFLDGLVLLYRGDVTINR